MLTFSFSDLVMTEEVNVVKNSVQSVFGVSPEILQCVLDSNIESWIGEEGFLEFLSLLVSFYSVTSFRIHNEIRVSFRF